MVMSNKDYICFGQSRILSKFIVWSTWITIPLKVNIKVPCPINVISRSPADVLIISFSN
jgi:hypothetical protein